MKTNFKLLIPTLLGMIAAIGLTYAQTSVTGPAGTYSATVTLSSAGEIPISLKTPTVGPPGKYTATVTTTAQTTITQTDTYLMISWGNSPIPPSPDPTPITTKLWVALFYDSKNPSHQDIVKSITLGPSLKQLNADWSAQDINTTIVTAWKPPEGVRLPALAVISVDGNNHGTAVPGFPLSLPDDANESFVLSTIQKLRPK